MERLVPKALVLASICVTLISAQDYSAIGADFMEPTVVQSPSAGSTVTTTLTVDQFRYEGPTSQIWTRAYNGGIPGPTIRIRRGDHVEILLVNNLGPNVDTPTHNEFHSPNTTNLHTHGLHVSSEAPADDVFITVSPGSQFQYIYNIPADHAGGTFWYHAHHHGSTALQAGGGLTGAIIVEDEEGDVPGSIFSMPERLLMLTNLPFGMNPTLRGIAQDSQDALTTLDYNSDGNNLVLVNGQYQPRVEITAGKYTRFRLIHSAIFSVLELTMEGGGCSMELLAKDGVYLPIAPRTVSTVILPPGARADVAIKCSSTGDARLVSGEVSGGGRKKMRRRSLLQRGRGGGGGGDGQVFQGLIASINVAANTGSDDADLACFSAVKPNYLADLYNLPNSQIATTREIDINGGGGTCEFDGNAFDPDVSHHTIMAGSVHQYDMDGTNGHPFHLHINSYQISAIAEGNTEGGYYQIGDWHDVLFTEASIRFQAADFTGKAVMHCHFLSHEDQGCMAYSVITDNPDGNAAPITSTYTTKFTDGSATDPVSCQLAVSSSSPTTIGTFYSWIFGLISCLVLFMV